MYVLVHKGDHYVGGTEAGVQFLKDCGTCVPYSFLGYLSAKESGMYTIFVQYLWQTLINIVACTGFMKTQSQTQGGAELDNKDSLRKAVESLFNKLYGKHM